MNIQLRLYIQQSSGNNNVNVIREPGFHPDNVKRSIKRADRFPPLVKIIPYRSGIELSLSRVRPRRSAIKNGRVYDRDDPLTLR